MNIRHVLCICLCAVSSEAYAKVDILVSLNKQTINVLVSHSDATQTNNRITGFDIAETHTWDISSGRRHHGTPTGTFTPTRLAAHYRSRKYHVVMPYSIFFIERYGIAIHAAIGSEIRHLGHFASHGCIRLSPENAETLYGIVKREGVSQTTITVS